MATLSKYTRCPLLLPHTMTLKQFKGSHHSICNLEGSLWGTEILKLKGVTLPILFGAWGSSRLLWRGGGVFLTSTLWIFFSLICKTFTFYLWQIGHDPAETGFCVGRFTFLLGSMWSQVSPDGLWRLQQLPSIYPATSVPLKASVSMWVWHSSFLLCSTLLIFQSLHHGPSIIRFSYIIW